MYLHFFIKSISSSSNFQNTYRGIPNYWALNKLQESFKLSLKQLYSDRQMREKVFSSCVRISAKVTRHCTKDMEFDVLLLIEALHDQARPSTERLTK